jgi:hypothetical protein
MLNVVMANSVILRNKTEKQKLNEAFLWKKSVLEGMRRLFNGTDHLENFCNCYNTKITFNLESHKSASRVIDSNTRP